MGKKSCAESLCIIFASLYCTSSEDVLSGTVDDVGLTALENLPANQKPVKQHAQFWRNDIQLNTS